MLRTNGKTEAKTSIEWSLWDQNIVDSLKKEKIDYTYQRVNIKENFKNMDIYIYIWIATAWMHIVSKTDHIFFYFE